MRESQRPRREITEAPRKTMRSGPHDNRQPREEQPKKRSENPQRRPTTGKRCDPTMEAAMARPHPGPAAELVQWPPQEEAWIPHAAPQDPCE
jgi:hypothetical protein